MSVLFASVQNYLVVSGSRVNGIWTPSELPATFLGDIQPAVGKDMENLPVGRRDRGAVKIYSNTRLNTSAQGSSNSGDIVLFQGRRWEVVVEKPWTNELLPHWEYYATECGEAS